MNALPRVKLAAALVLLAALVAWAFVETLSPSVLLALLTSATFCR